MNQIYLNGEGWLFKEFVGLDWVWRNSVQADSRDTRWWYKATVPGSILNDLWKMGKVADPYFELNSKLMEWVPQRTWIYRKSFTTPTNIEGKKVTLCFEGIDYSSEIFVNGKSIGRQEGMFIPFEYDVTDMLLKDQDNLLAVVIDAAPVEQPQVGRTSLVRTHKTRMNYWWDFCPRMIHQGIWDSVYLRITGQAIIKNVYISAELQEDFSGAVLTAEIEITVDEECDFFMEVASQTATVLAKEQKTSLKVFIPKPTLWQPNGYGEPYQYDINIYLKDKKGIISDERRMKFGIRKIEFEKNESCHADATSFVLKVNGRKIYMNGYNWVPMDAMYGVERPEKLHRLIQLAKEANTVMFRVWGGGLIEKDTFYEACAENGILVWQEFILSSSGIDNKPPEDTAFMDMLITQAKNIIKRKRNHTALAIWCGGNELSDWEGNPVDNTDPLISRLKETVNRLDPQRRWLSSSPSGGVFNNTVKNILEHPDMLWDVHGPWEHQGMQKHCELYNMGTSLLHSEFGVEGMTNRNTLIKSMSEKNLLPASRDNEIYFHRGSWWINEPLVQEMFNGLNTIDEIRKASQYMQFEGLKYAVECNRRRAFQNSGTFPWQFNEPYPNNYSTSSLDYYANPKPVYYGVRNSYGKILVSASFDSPSVFEKSQFSCKTYVSTSLLETEIKELGELYLLYEIVGTDGTFYYEKHIKCSLPANSSKQETEILLDTDIIRTQLFLLRIKLRDQRGECIAENEYLFTKEKHWGNVFDSCNSHLQIKQTKNCLSICNAGEQAVLYLFVTNDETLPHSDFLYFNKNYFCLLPREERMIEIHAESGIIEEKPLLLESFQGKINFTLGRNL